MPKYKGFNLDIQNVKVGGPVNVPIHSDDATGCVPDSASCMAKSCFDTCAKSCDGTCANSCYDTCGVSCHVCQ